MRTFKLSMAAVLFLACAAIVPESRAQSDADEIAKVRTEIDLANKVMMDAWAKGDARAQAELYTEDAQLLLSGMEPVKGRTAIQASMAEFFKDNRMDVKMNTVELEVFGDTAVEVGGYVMNSLDGQHLDHGKYIVIWKKVDGKWRLHRDIANSSMQHQ